MNATKAAAKATTKGTRKGAKATKKTSTKAKELPVVTFTADSLRKIGFERGEKTVFFETVGLNRIGRMLENRGLVPESADWWLCTNARKDAHILRFICKGRSHEINVEGYGGRGWQVKLTQGPNELEAWLEKRPSEPHPERTRLTEWELDEGVLTASMKLAKADGIDNFEDFVNKVITEHFERTRPDAFAVRLGTAIGDRVAAHLQQKGGSKP